jgi:hypothetical protein
MLAAVGDIKVDSKNARRGDENDCVSNFIEIHRPAVKCAQKNKGENLTRNFIVKGVQQKIE